MTAYKREINSGTIACQASHVPSESAGNFVLVHIDSFQQDKLKI